MQLTLASQCVDIVFVEPGDKRLPEINETNCFNSTQIGFADIYTITTKDSGSSSYATSAAAAVYHTVGWASFAPLLGAALWLLL